MKKRFLSLFIIAALMMSMLPTMVMAYDSNDVDLGGDSDYFASLKVTNIEKKVDVVIITLTVDLGTSTDWSYHIGPKSAMDGSVEEGQPFDGTAIDGEYIVGVATSSKTVDITVPKTEYGTAGTEIWLLVATNGTVNTKVFTFSITKDGDFAKPQATAPGEPTITATDSDSGSSTTVELPKMVTLTAQPNALDTDSGDHTYTYAWTGPQNFTATTAAITIDTVAGTGTYSVTATRTKTDGSTSDSDASVAATQAVTITKGTYGKPTLAISGATYEYGSGAPMPTLTPTTGAGAVATAWTYAVGTGTSATVAADGTISLAGSTSAEKIGATTFTVKATGNANYNESPASDIVTLTVSKGTPAATAPSKTGVLPGATVENYAVTYSATDSPFKTANNTKIPGIMTITSSDKGTIAGGATVGSLAYSFAPTDGTLYKTVTGNDASLTAAAAKELVITWGTINGITYGANAPIVAPTVTDGTSTVTESGNWKLEYQLDGGAKKTALTDASFLSTSGKLKVGTYTITLTSISGLYTAPAANTKTFAVAAKEIEIVKDTLAIASKEYDAKTTVGAVTGAYKFADTAVIAGDAVTIDGTATYAFADKTAVTGKAVKVTGLSLSGNDKANYTLKLTGGSQIASLTGDISQKTVTVNLPADITKVYDTKNTLPKAVTDLATTASTTNVTGFITGDTAALTLGTSAYAGTDVGTTAINWTGVALTGTDAANYSLTAPTAAGAITKADQAALVLTGVGTTAKYGDVVKTLGTTGGSGTGVVTYTLTAADGSATLVGNQLTIAKSGSFTIKATKPADTNYKAVDSATITCTVAKKELTLAKTTATGRNVDGATGVTFDSTYLPNPDGLETLTDAGATLTFAKGTTDNVKGSTIAGNKLTWDTDAVATTATDVNVTMAENAHYTLASNSKIVFTVTAKVPATVTMTGATITYGQATPNWATTTTDAPNTSTFTYEYQTDGSGAWNATAPTDVGNHKVRATLVNDTHAGTSAEVIYVINPKTLEITWNTPVFADKAYDGKTETSIPNPTAGTPQLSDGATPTVTYVRVTSDVGNAVVVKATITGFSGVSATNYQLPASAEKDNYGTVKVTPVALSFTLPTISKVYDGKTAIEDDDIAAIEGTALSGKVGQEAVTLAIGTAKYSSKGVGAVIVIDGAFALDGNDAGNYTLTQPTDPSGAITAKSLTVAPVASVSKTDPATLTVADLLTTSDTVGEDSIAKLFTAPLKFIDGTASDDTDNTWTTDDGVTVIFYAKDGTTVLAKAPTAVGEYRYTIAVADDATFGNYDLQALTTSDVKNITITSGGGGGIVPPSTVKVTFDAGVNGKIEGSATFDVAPGGLITKFPVVKANEGFVFKGWSEDGKTIINKATYKVTKAVKLMALYTKAGIPQLNYEDHITYIEGYNNGLFMPDNSITRAEVVAIFSRLMLQQPEAGKVYTSTFTDVPADAWYANAIGFMSEFKVIEGDGDGTFRPNSPITRAEFATVASRFDELTLGGTNNFSDVTDGMWAKDYILSASAKGWVDGYADGTFRPERNITRAEVVKVVNTMLGRNITAESIQGHEFVKFTDVTAEHWAYFHVIEAATKHDYKIDGGKEIWTK